MSDRKYLGAKAFKATVPKDPEQVELRQPVVPEEVNYLVEAVAPNGRMGVAWRTKNTSMKAARAEFVALHPHAASWNITTSRYTP